MLLGLGGHAIAAGDLADFDAVSGDGVVGDQFFDGGANARADFGGVDFRGLGEDRVLDERDDLVERNRDFGRVDDGFELGFERHNRR